MKQYISFLAKDYKEIVGLKSFMEKNLNWKNLSIEETSADFSANVNITTMSNGSKFVTIDSYGYRIKYHKIDNIKHKMLYIIYSDYRIYWGRCGGENTIPYKDVFLIDNTHDFFIESPGSQKIKLIAIPFHLLDGRLDSIIDSLAGKKFSTVKYGNAINMILVNSSHRTGLDERINIVTNFLKIMTYDDTMEKNLKYNFIVKKISINLFDEEFSLSKLAHICSLSPRAIQYILSSKGTTFNELLADLKLNILCKNILLMKGKKVNEIVFLSGYNSFSTASRHFKKKYNKTIKEYCYDLK